MTFAQFIIAALVGHSLTMAVVVLLWPRRKDNAEACARECVSYFWPKDKVHQYTRDVAHREVAGIVRRFMGVK